MSNIKEAFKRFLSVALSVTTTVWLSGLTLLLPVTPVLAVTPEQYGLKEGDLIRAPSLPAPEGWKVYIVNQHGYKRHIFNPDVFNMYGHFSWDSVKDVSADVVNAFITSDLYRVSGTEPVYSVDENGIKRWLNMTAEQFTAKGYDWNQVFVVNATEGAYYTVGSDITADGTVVTPPPAGSIAISLASNTPATAVIPIGATGVSFLKFVVGNGTSNEVSITNVTAHREGPGATADFSNVYLFQGATRLTSGRSVNSSTHNAVFSGLDVKIPAGGSVTLDIVGDLASTATSGNVHVFSVSDVTVSGTAATGKATGNVMTVASVAGGTITIAKNGTLSNPKVGEKGVEVAQFQLTVGSTEDVKLSRLLLTNAGNVTRSELTNFMLKDRATNTTLATVSGLNSKDQAVFELSSPVLLEKGNAKTYSVYADVGGGVKGNDTIRMYLENSADLLAVGQTYGFGARVTSGAYDNGSNDGTDASWTTVQVGQLTIVFNGPAAKDIAKNGKDIDVYTFSMTAQVEVEVRQIALIFDSSNATTTNFNDGTTPNYTDIKIWDTDSNTVVWGPQDLSGTGSATSQTLTFTEDILLAPNKIRNFKVTLDVANNSDVVDANTIRATIQVSSLASQVKNLQNNTFLAAADIVPGSNVVGNNMTVRVAGLTVSLATSPTSQTYVKGSSDLALVGFNFAAGVGQIVKITSIKVTCYIDDSNVQTDFVKGQDTDDGGGTTSCQDDVTQMRLKVDGAQIGDNKSPAATTDGTATFNNLTLTIPAGTTKVVAVHGDISASAFRNSNVERVAIDIADVSDEITASDPDGNTVTATGDAVNGGTSPNRIITIQNTGTLTVAAAPTETNVTDSRVVEAGLSKVTFSKFKFTAQNEALNVTKARVRVVSVDADSAVTSVITALYLYDQDGTLVAGPTSLTPVTAAGTTDAQADFNTIATFAVPKDDSRTLTVKADLNTSSGLTQQMGQQFNITLEADDNAEARGVGQSGTVLTDLGDDVAGNNVILRKGQPKVELVTLPTTTLTNGTTILMKFKVTALSNDIALKHFTFETASSDGAVTLASPAVRKSSDKVNLSASSTTSGTTTKTTNITFNSEQTITKGGSVEYEFIADITLANAADTLSTKILGDTAVVTGELGPLAAAQQIDDLDALLNVGNDTDNSAAFNFIWSDQSSIPHNDTAGTVDGADDATPSNDWTNGNLVRTVPTDTQSLTFPS